MEPESVKYFHDILDSIDLIFLHYGNISSLKDFQKNLTVIDAVERRLSIIGEALYQIKKKDSIVLQITDYKKIIGLRHILIHDYDLIDHATIWIIITQKLHVLKKEIETILKD